MYYCSFWKAALRLLVRQLQDLVQPDEALVYRKTSSHNAELRQVWHSKVFAACSRRPFRGRTHGCRLDTVRSQALTLNRYITVPYNSLLYYLGPVLSKFKSPRMPARHRDHS